MKQLLLVIGLIGISHATVCAQSSKRPTNRHRTQKNTYKTTYYYPSNTPAQTDATRPSAYKGDKVPENDGLKKNKQRNLNYTSGQPLPSSNGK